MCRRRGEYRDFKQDPVLIITVGESPSSRKPVKANQHDACPVPCEYIGHTRENELISDGYLLIQGQKRCAYQKTAHLTMENVQAAGYDLLMDTRLDSDVPAGYYSWVGVNFWKKPIPKTMKALSSAYISNCAASSGRDQIVLDLQRFGVSVDSYGRCNKNVHVAESEPKAVRMGRYKFYLAFENSITDDYITEKYFQALESGTLPVYLGAPNIRHYEPQPGSILRVPDFKNTQELAKHLLMLANNTAEYEKYFIWKKIGPSDSFKALIDISSVHSYCRLCLKMADLYVTQYGKTETHPTAILVRERLTFYFKPIELGNDKTLKNLKEKILHAFKDHTPIWHSQSKLKKFNNVGPGFKKGKLKIYRIHKAYLKMKETLFGFAYDSDEKVAELKPGDKIEVIFV